jgi:hypothetical protein
MKYSLRSVRITLYMAVLAAFALGLFFGTLLSGLGETASIILMGGSLLCVMVFACWALIFVRKLAKEIELQKKPEENSLPTPSEPVPISPKSP